MTEQKEKASVAENSPTKEEEEPNCMLVHLDSLFLYQNTVTGEASKTHLTTRQLCRILCPANTKVKQLLTPETNVLLAQQEPNGSSDSYYYSSGWMPARTVPVLREAVTLWYSFKDGTVGPAVSSRALPRGENVRYASALTNSEWKTIEQLPHLQNALDAFEQQPQPPPPPIVAQHQSAITPNESASPANNIVQEELEAFLQSTEKLGQPKEMDDEEEFESDGGTRYVKDARTGKLIHEDLYEEIQKKKSLANVPTVPQVAATNGEPLANTTAEKATTSGSHKRKHVKAKFSAKKGRCWIYVTGLPTDCTQTEVADLFSKAGLLDLDPETQQPKIKLYRHKDGTAKGDASICYARPESVSLAITLFDGTPFRATTASTGVDKPVLLTVEMAKFEQRGKTFDAKRGKVSNAKRKVAKMATMQAVDWDEGEFNGRLTGGRKGLRIIVLKRLFHPGQFTSRTGASSSKEDAVLQALELDLRTECEQWGVVEKITVFSQHPQGVAVIKFTQPGAASEAVKQLSGREWKGDRKIEASFWDGVTDFTTKSDVNEEKETQIREEAFGNWLESQELPEELRLKSE